MDLVEMLRDTLGIAEKGGYTANGREVRLHLKGEEMRRARVLLPEDVYGVRARAERCLPVYPGGCAIGCENTDSFSAALRVHRERARSAGEMPVLVLNFANPVHPGGGVRQGARAQEEDLCRKSTLLLSLESDEAKPYYEYNKNRRSYLGSDAMIFTPQAEIMRDANGELLESPVTVAVLTCAAPVVNAGFIEMTAEEYRSLLFERIAGMLVCAAYFGYRDLVLGAWGCGAFGNDAAVVAEAFHAALYETVLCGAPLGSRFSRVAFAVPDRSQEKYNFRQFSHFFAECDPIPQGEANLPAADALYADRARGCLVGGAAGDALGYAVEFLDEGSIRWHYGENGIMQYDKDDSGKAQISDDTQMTMFTANGLLVYDTARAMGKAEGPAVRYVAAAYRDWLGTQYTAFQKADTENRVSWLCDVPDLYSPRAPGNTCISALQQLKKGAPLPDTDRPINNSKGCGGVMRVAPVGLLRAAESDIRTVAVEGANAAAVTHGHPLGWLPAAALAVTVRLSVDPGRRMTLRETVLTAVDTVASVFAGKEHIDTFTNLMRLAVSLSENTKDDLENIHRLGQGWVGEEALAIAVYCALRHQSDFSACIRAAVNHKGDSDSTGAVAGNILGAWLGLEAIDPVWKRDLELYDELIELADDLVSGCRLNENGAPDPAWERKYVQMRR